jgi:carbon-monoxide dehydrogenase iron sulfur subunit
MKNVFVNEEACMGCHLCQVYCRLQHSPADDLIKAFNREPYLPLPLVQLEKREPISFALQCRHCAEPYCVYSCLTGALEKDPENGIVAADVEKCIGCWTCVLACPFGVIRRDLKQKKMVKCDLCMGEDIPACVTNCPNEALVYAEVPEQALTQ